MPVPCFAAAAVLLLGFALPVAAQFEDNLDVPYVPTPPEVVETMLKMANVKKGDFVIDLGCGDGRIVVMAALKFGARGLGVDLNPERIKEANANALAAGVADRVKFVEQNLFDADIKAATVVTLYLLPGVNLKLRPKLLADLKPGTRIVSHSFDMGDWKQKKLSRWSGANCTIGLFRRRRTKTLGDTGYLPAAHLQEHTDHRYCSVVRDASRPPENFFKIG